jgi:hypothetical protein
MNEDVKRTLGVLAVVAVLAAGCASPSSARATPSSAASSAGPSASALMVCSIEAQADIELTIGVGPSTPPGSTFNDGLFTCDYVYSTGTMVLSVKDLTDKADTDAYVKAARAGVASVQDLPALGQAAFSDSVSTVIVVKDFKVLKVDTSGLPDPFGQPPHTRYTVAVAVAAAIILCWTGA